MLAHTLKSLLSVFTIPGRCTRNCVVSIFCWASGSWGEGRTGLKQTTPAHTKPWFAGQVSVLCNYNDISICSHVSRSLACIPFAFESYSSGTINTERCPGNLMPCGAKSSPSKCCQEDSLFIALFIRIPVEENSQEKNLASWFEAHLVFWVVKEQVVHNNWENEVNVKLELGKGEIQIADSFVYLSKHPAGSQIRWFFQIN